MQRDNGRINYGVSLDNSQLRIDAQQSKRIISEVGSTAVSEGNKIDSSMKKIGAAIAGTFAVAKLKDYAVQVAKVRGEFQQLEIAFNTMLGSKSKADALMSQLIRTAATTPFGMTDISNSAKQLLAYGVEADKVNETLIRLGDIAAGLSIPINDLAYLYGTTMVQGRMYTQDLNQFLGRGIPLTAELAKQFQVAESKVKTLVEEGKVGFPEVEKAIISMTSEGGKFGGLMEAQSKSITGQLSNLEDAVEQMFNEIGKSTEDTISGSIGLISTLVENWRTVGSVILSLVAGYGAYKAAVITMNVVQKINNMLMQEAALQQKLAAMSGITLSNAQAMAAAKTTLLTAAMQGLKAAIMSNPIGLILGVLATAITAFTAFNAATSKASELSTKFGDTAANTITRLNTLTTTLKGLTSGTETHRKVTEELNEILQEYGITQIQEGDNIDIVNKKREQAIELIKQEAIERQRANALDTGMQDYQNAVNDASKTLLEDLQGAMTGGFFISGNDEIRENASAISTIVADIVQNNISKIAGKTGEEYQKGIQEIYAEIQDRMRAIGISEETIASQWLTDDLFNHTNLIQDYINAIQEAKEQHNRYTDAVNKSADAEKEAAESTMTWSERIDATKRSLQGATDDVHKLYTNIKNLMSKYNKNTIGFDIVFSTQVPKWMESMDIKELQRLAKEFSAMGDQAAKQGLAGLNVNGKYFTTQQLLQRGADYAQAAENKQAEADRQKREDEANEKERQRKAKQAKEKAERERKQIADETAQRTAQIREYSDRVSEAVQQAELDIRQADISAKEDGYEKSIAQVNLNYDRLIAENKKREQEMIDDLKDKMTLEWLNANPKATKEEQINYRASLNVTRADLSSEQIAMLEEYERIAANIRTQGNKMALDDMLSDVLTYEQQRLEIAEEYEKKRQALYTTDSEGNKVLRSGVTQGNVSELDRQEEEALTAVDEQFALREETYKAWCDQIANMTLEQLEDILAKAEQELAALEKEGSGADSKQLSTARAKVSTAKKKVEQARAKESTSPDKRSIKEWEDLYKTLQECEREFESIGDTVGGVAGEIISQAGGIMTASLSMINGIVQLVNMSTTGVQTTAVAASTAIQTVEKASVILTIISAALQIATAIANMFNDDDKKQEEIEHLQSRIDQLQWELDNQDAIQLQKNSFNAMDKLREVTANVRKEFYQLHMAVGDTWGAFRSMFVKLSKDQDMLTKAAEELAKAYGNIAYSADKFIGQGRYDNAQKQLQNIAEQQLLIQEQINAERSKKDTDQGKIDEWEQKIQELGEQAVTIINDMVEDIIGGSSNDIAEQLSDAFFEAFENGEDAAEAWGDKVNEIVAEVMKRMLVQKFLEEPLGEIFDKYKQKWFKDGNFQGMDVVINSLGQLANDLNEAGAIFMETWDALPDSIKNMLQVTDEAVREASEKGIATASQESVDELNGRATAIQGHTYSIAENTKSLLSSVNLILTSVQHIESHSEDISDGLTVVRSDIREMRDTINDMAIKGVKIK